MAQEPSPLQVALRGLCPRCGSRTLFNGIATFAPKCRACGLEFASFNVGDGPAAFLILIVGGIVTALAMRRSPCPPGMASDCGAIRTCASVELAAEPPFWVHILLWLPLTLLLVVGLLRLAKAALLALEFKHEAREARPGERQ